MLRFVTALCVLALLVPASSFGKRFSNDRHPHHVFRPYGIQMLFQNADRLNLTDKQKVALQALSTDSQLELIDKRAEFSKAKLRLRALQRQGGTANRQEVMAQIDRVANTRADIMKLRYTQREQIQAILTVEQLEKMREIHKQYLDERRQRIREGIHERRPGVRRG